MTTYTVTNNGDVSAGAGTDRLEFIVTIDYGFYMYPPTGDLASGYSGAFFSNYQSYNYTCKFYRDREFHLHRSGWWGRQHHYR